MLIAATAATWHWGPAAWTRVQVLYWQRQCMSYTAPADMVVYEEEPEAAKVLLGQAQYSDLDTAGNGRPSAAFFRPVLWERYAVLSGLHPTFHTSGAIVFLGELQAPSGQKFIAAVSYLPRNEDRLALHVNLHWGVRLPAAVLRPPEPPPGGDFIPAIIPVPDPAGRGQNTRMFAGQRDPADPSHFTIRYQMWGREDIIDGRIDDQGYVTLTPRNLLTRPVRPN